MQPIIVRADFSKAIILRLFGRAADWLLLHKPFTRAKGAALDARPESQSHRARGGSGGTRPCDCAAPSVHLTHPSLSQRSTKHKERRKLRFHGYRPVCKYTSSMDSHKKLCALPIVTMLLRASICVVNYYWADRLLTVRTQQQPIILLVVDLCKFAFSAYTLLIDRMERN
jgi:hypothetical protein